MDPDIPTEEPVAPVVAALPVDLSTQTQIRQTRNFDLIPPGGVLGTIGVPGEIIPARDHLRIEEYSNEVYWRFAPYLDSVRRVLESSTPVNAVLTNSTRTSETALKACMNLMIKGVTMCGSKICKSSMRLWRRT